MLVCVLPDALHTRLHSLRMRGRVDECSKDGFVFSLDVQTLLNRYFMIIGLLPRRSPNEHQISMLENNSISPAHRVTAGE